MKQGRRLGVLGGANAPPKKIFAPPQGILGGGAKNFLGGAFAPPKTPRRRPCFIQLFQQCVISWGIYAGDPSCSNVSTSHYVLDALLCRLYSVIIASCSHVVYHLVMITHVMLIGIIDDNTRRIIIVS